MEPLVLPKDTTPDQYRYYKQLEEVAHGTMVTLASAPTSTEKLLETNQWGLYGTKLYFNIAGTIYESQLAATA